jgi:cytochrome P450
VHVHPDIARSVGDVNRPTGWVQANDKLAHLPGRTGILAGLETRRGIGREGQAYLTREREKYGPVFRLQLGANPVVCVADPDHIWTITHNEDGAWSAAVAWYERLGGLWGNGPVDGLLDLDGDYHRSARLIFQQAFGPAALSAYVSDACSIFDRAIDRWTMQGHVAFKKEARDALAIVSARTLMGVDDPAEALRLDAAQSDLHHVLFARVKRTLLAPTWRRAHRAGQTLWNTFRPRVAERRASRASDLFSRICQARTDDAWIDDDTLLRLFVGVLFAAYDTTASGVASMAYLLAKHPEWQERLREELPAGAPGLDELRGLPLHDRFWRETLRFFPVAGQIVRQTLRDVSLGRFFIPAGTIVFPLLGTAMRDPAYWTSPGSFDPDRFSPERAEDRRHRATFLPFGSGPHTCLGIQLSTLLSKLLFSRLIARCRWSLSPDYVASHRYTPLGTVSGSVDLRLDFVR